MLEQTEDQMQKRISALDSELTRVRTGRASITLLDRISVSYYGSQTPLNQVATLAAPDAKTITISPFEKSLLGEIEKSIFKANLGLSPVNDGNIIRIAVPQLTEERRKDIVKSLKKIGEEAKVSVRKFRRDANDDIKKQEKAKSISEDDGRNLQQDIQKVTDKYIKVVDEKIAAKEKEVMTI